MKRLTLPSSLIFGLALSLGTAAVAPTAYAQDRTEKNERRVVSVNELDVKTRESEELRRQAQAVRLESIKRLETLIASTDPQGDQKAEMLLRLADLYFEEGRELYLDEMEKFQKEVDACFNDSKRNDCNDIKPETYTVSSRKWQEKSVKVYRNIVNNYPQFARADEAVFYLASALNDMKMPDDAVKEYRRLVKDYPQSGYMPDAYVQIGEYWFERNKAFEALQAYQRAAQYKESDRYAFALYKLAWCYYNVNEYEKSISTMKTVVNLAQTSKTSTTKAGKQAVELEDEALNDLVRFFADAGQMEEAIAYFKQLGKPELVTKVLRKLATTYFEQGKYEQAIEMYRRMISDNPQSIQAPEMQNEIVQCYDKMGQKQQTLDEIERLRTTYGKSSSWARTNAANTDAVKNADDLIEKNLRTVATNYHNEAKKLKTGKGAEAAYAAAEQAYRTYLESYPSSKNGYEVRYSFSELLYYTKKYDEAYEQYMAVVKTDPKGQYSQFCAESAIFAAKEMVKKTGGNQRDPNNKKDPVELTDWEKKLLAAFDQYRELFPTGPKVKDAIYESGFLLYNKNQFKEASDRFRVVIKMEPKSKQAMYAANLILDSFVLTEDWANLKEVSKSFYDQKDLGDADFKKEVYTIYQNASLQLIELGFTKDQDKAKAADAYWAFYQEFPASEKADIVLNNASVYYHDLGRVTDEIRTRLELVNKFPKSKYFKDHLAGLGFAYESMGDFVQASDWYEKIFAQDKDHAASKDAIFSAAYFRAALGQWETAVKDYQQYITAYPTDEKVPGINIEIAKTYEQNQKYQEAARIYLAFFTKPPTGAAIDDVYYARLHYGLLMDKIGQGAKQAQHWKDTVAAYDKDKKAGAPLAAANDYVGQILFMQAESQFKAFMAMKIDGPAGKSMPRSQMDKLLNKQLIDKLTAFQKLEATYATIVNTGSGEWGLASLVRLGEASENMASSLINSYRPDYLTEDQKELYGMALEDRAFPLSEKAATYYSSALEKAYELHLYTDYTANAVRRLGEMRPKDFPGFAENYPALDLASPSTSSAPFESQP